MKLSLTLTLVALTLAACSGGGEGCYSGLEVDCASAGDVGADELQGPDRSPSPEELYGEDIGEVRVIEIGTVAIVLIMGIGWVWGTSRAGEALMLGVAGPAIGFVVWLAAMFAGGVLGEYASLWVGLTWR